MSATGSTASHRVRLNLTIQVKKIVFAPAGNSANQEGSGGGDQEDSSPTAVLHIIGPVTSENDQVKLGAYHTLDIEAFRDVRIEKEDGWDSIALGRVEEAIVPGRGAEVAAVVCGEGTAAFCLLSQHMTIVTHRLNVPIPRKASATGAAQHEKGMDKFYSALFDAFLRHIPYANVSLKAIIIASPGWIRDSVYDHIINQALNRGDKVLHKAMKEKGVKVHISSPHVHSLVEVLKSPEVSLKASPDIFPLSDWPTA